MTGDQRDDTEPAEPRGSELIPSEPPDPIVPESKADAPEPTTTPVSFEPAEPEPAAAVTTPPASPAPRPPLVSRVHILPATTVALAVVSVLLGLMVFSPGIAPIKLGATRAAAEALTENEIEDAAARFARSFVTIDYRTIDADFARIRNDATGKMRSDLSRIADVIREPYREAKIVSRGREAEAQVLSRSGDTASVRVVVRLEFQNTQAPDPQTVTRSLDLTLVKTSAGWRVADASQQTPPTVENP